MDRATPTVLQRNLYWIAILPLLLLPASAWLMLSYKRSGQPALLWTGIALFLSAIAVFIVAMTSRYHRLTVASGLDERELALFYRISDRAYRIYAVITLLGCCYSGLAQMFGGPTVAGIGWLFLMTELTNLFWLLPIIILEWSADPRALEEEE
jgi:hypothetical protein